MISSFQKLLDLGSKWTEDRQTPKLWQIASIGQRMCAQDRMLYEHSLAATKRTLTRYFIAWLIVGGIGLWLL